MYTVWTSSHKIEVFTIGLNMAIVLLFGQFLLFQTGVHMGDLLGYNVSKTLYHPCNLLGYVWYNSLLVSSWVSTIIDISIELNLNRNSKNKLFSPLCVDLTLM